MGIDLAEENARKIKEAMSDDTIHFFDDGEGNDNSSDEGASIFELDEDTIMLIDFNDKKYINRLSNIDELRADENFKLLKEHIRNVRLIQFPELEQTNEGKFRVINGYRRCLALKSLIEEGHNIANIENSYYVHYDETYDENKQDSASLGENFMRKDLNSLEFAFKIKKEVDSSLKNSKEEKYEEIAEKYSMSARSIQRYYTSYKYPEVLHKVITEEGFTIVEELYSLVRLFPERTPESIVEDYRGYTRQELREKIKELKNKKEKQFYNFKVGKKSSTIKINSVLSETQIEMINEFLKTIK